MPKHLRWWIMWSLQNYRWIVFIVCIWQMGKWGLERLSSRRGQLITKLWRQANLTPLFSSSEQFWNFSGENHLQFIQSADFRSSFSKVLMCWFCSRLEKYAFITPSPDDSPTGGPQTTSTGELRDDCIPFLWSLTSPTFSGRRRELHCYLKLRHVSCCQAHGCPLLASRFLKPFLNPLSTQANLIPLWAVSTWI